MGSSQSSIVKDLQKFIKKERSEGSNDFEIIDKIRRQKIIGIVIERQKTAIDPMNFHSFSIVAFVPCKDNKIKMITATGYSYNKDVLAEQKSKKVIKKIMKL